jgi:tetratricopeptide (TPR) repeat protein
MDLINNPFLKVNNNSDNPQCVKFTEAEEKAMVLHTWFDYLKLLAIPYPLTSDYYPKHIGVSEHDTKPTEGTNITELRDENGKVRYIKDDLPTFGSPIVILSILLHLAMAVIAFWGIRKRNPISFALIFYAATFSVVSNLFFPIGTLLAERFMFMPSIALSLVCGYALSKVTFSNDNSIKKLGFGISLTVFAIVLSFYSVISFSRNFDWYDNSTLFIKDIKVSENSAKMNNDYANALLEINRKSKNISFDKRKQLCKEAIFYSANSINIYPLNKDAWVTHGLSYYSLADIIKIEADSLKSISNNFNEILKLYNHSITIFQKAREFGKSNVNIKYNLKNVYQSKGNLLATLGRVKEAILDFEQANNYTDGYDVEIKRLLSAVNSVAAINSLKESDTLSSQEYHKQCLIAIDKGVKITPVHMLETIANIKKAYLGLARENKEFEPISNQRVEELNKIIKSIDPNYKER